jgi:cation diffusion facilitator family transporter
MNSIAGAETARLTRLTLIGIFVSALLATVKIVAGVIGNAYALIADGVESLTDILSSFVVWGTLRIASLPADENHPFGHSRAESLGVIMVGLVLLAAAAGIGVQSVREILIPHHAPAPFTLVVLVLVVATKEVLFRLFRRGAATTGSRAAEGEALHHRSDALTSAAAFVGISIALIGGPGYEPADDWAALVACGVIAWNGVRLLRAALDDVMDAAPPPEEEMRIREVAAAVQGVRGVEKCRVRRSGLVRFVDIHIEVNGDLTVREGHAIGHAVKSALISADPRIADVSIHVEPWEPAP